MTDLVERLRKYGADTDWALDGAMMIEAADEIERLRDALKPFAQVGYDIISSRDDDDTIDDTMAAERLTWGDLRAASAALKGTRS